MKKHILLLLIFLKATSLASFAQYDKQNISLVGHWNNPQEVAEPGYGIKYQSIWGWVDTAHNAEYAIQGSSSGTYFIDLSIPSNPVVRDFVAGRRSLCIWREYKTYGHYLYAISDDQSPNSLQIIDMSYLPDSVHVVYDDTTLFERSHTLYIAGDKLYCGSVTRANGGGYYSMAVYSLANPELPALLRVLSQDDPNVGYAHDMFVRNDTVYASCGYQGLFIYKFNSNNTFSLINSLTSYPDQGYNHSSFLTPNGQTLVFCDEVPRNLSVKLIDVSDLQNISIESTFKSTEGATAHNPYIFGTNRAVIAYYMDGLQIYNIENPALPVRTGYFDTDTTDGINNNYNQPNTAYRGCWGAYVDLPSKLILASDMQNGLFVLNADIALGVSEKNNASKNKITIYPNPVINTVSVNLQLENADEIVFEVFDVMGKKISSQKQHVTSGSTTKKMDTEQLQSGVYLLKASSNLIQFSTKFIKQ
jgi:choice-of-anchor B domain-containing protein